MTKKNKDYFNSAPIYRKNLLQSISFEAISFVGRVFFSKKPPTNKRPKLLQVGSGTNYVDGFVNADFIFGLRFWKRRGLKKDWGLDLRYPLNCDDNFWDGIFSEHTLEHLYYEEAFRLLKELYRTLKENAWIRIIVPDADIISDYYLGKMKDCGHFKGMSGAEALSFLTQDCLHRSVYNSEQLTKMLTLAGFSNVKKVSFRRGSDSRLFIDLFEHKPESLYVEAQKC